MEGWRGGGWGVVWIDRVGGGGRERDRAGRSVARGWGAIKGARWL